MTKYLETVIYNEFIPHHPTDKQAYFLIHDHIPEILYGGAAGGGKSDALLMAALQYANHPGYAALILRRTYSDLALPGAIMDRAHEWLGNTKAHWNNTTTTWEFPSGATLTFGYLQGPRDHFRYQGSEFQFVGFDELTQFKETQYLYLHSRLRRLSDSSIPLRMRCASNPGDIGHEWVKERFISSIVNPQTTMFIPATLEDNPYLDKETYIQSLMKLDPVTREQLLSGNWDVRLEGGLFKRQWFTVVDDYPRDVITLRYWDKAASQGKGDYTAGALLGIIQGKVYIINMQHERLNPGGVEALIKQTAAVDGQQTMIRIEQEPGSAGVDVIDHYARYVLQGYNFKGIRSTGSKVSRAGAIATAAEMGNVYIVRGAWNAAFLEEVSVFPNEAYHDDQVDAVSGAYNALTLGMSGPGILVMVDDYGI